MNLFMMFAEESATVSDFVVNVVPIVRIILISLAVLACIGLIITTLLQSSANETGSTAISGGASDTYFSQNKDNSKDARLKRATIWLASIILVCVILYFVTNYFLN